MKDELAELRAILARIHEVFDNLAPGRAGRVGAACRLYLAGWRSTDTVEEARALMSRGRTS